MTILTAGPQHLPAWADMRAALWPEEDRGALRTEAGELMKHNRCHVLLAECDELVAGFIELTLRSHVEGCGSSPAGYVEAWFVAPAYRSRGVGATLMKAAEQWCREQGCRHIGSDTEVTNARSRAAHRALGFTELPASVGFFKSL